MKQRITIVGLGPGGEGEITLGALKALEQGERVILRTENHGIVPFLREQGLDFTTLDSLHDSCDSFEELYPAMIREILTAMEQGELVLGIPGHPLVGERLVLELLGQLDRSVYQVEVLPGISRADALMALVQRSGAEGVKVLAAGEAASQILDPGMVTVILDIHQLVVASDLKVRLLEVYPPDMPVFLSRQETGGHVVCEEIPLHTLDHDRGFDHTSCLYLPTVELTALTRFQFSHLLKIMEMLRAPEGCPWDREQDHESLKQYLIEETYEVLEAIDLKDMDKLVEELGDLLLQVVFHAQIAGEHGEFDMMDVTTGICRKMIDRHTHIFGDVKVTSAEEVLGNWEAIKKQEKGLKSQTQVLRDIPSNLPALMRGYKVQKKAALVGFDWDHVSDAIAKVEEELQELKEVHEGDDPEKIHEELGDLLFAVVNVARFLKVQPELALTDTIEKFIRRFAYIEEHADRPLEEMTLEEMDALWNQAKSAFQRGSDV